MHSNTRCDALFKKDIVSVDVQRCEMSYTTRSMKIYPLCQSIFCMHNITRYNVTVTFAYLCRACLKSLQGVGGAYCLVTAGKDHAVRGGSLRNFSEGDNIRVIRPKEARDGRKKRKVTMGVVQHPEVATNATVNVGYGLKLTYDLPVGKSVGMLRVRACWHDVVFRNELGFTESMFLY
jgi:hypothetical protein